MASDRLLTLLGLIGDQMFKEKDVPVVDKSRYMTNGQASINPVQEYLYGEMPGTALEGTQFSGLAQQYGDRNLRVDPLKTAPMSRELEQNTMEQDIVDKASLLNMPYQPMSEFDRAEYDNAKIFSQGGYAEPYQQDMGVTNNQNMQQQDANTAIQNLGYMTPGQMDNERASMSLNSVANAEVPAELKEMTSNPYMGSQDANTAIQNLGYMTPDQMNAEADVAGFAPLTPQENIPAQTQADSNVDKLINSDFATNMSEYENLNVPEKLEANFFDHVKDFFGDEKSLLMLALGFNSMRLNPDATLATAIGKRLETLQDFSSKDEVYDEIMSYAMQKGTSTSERNRLLAIANILKKGGLTPKEASNQAFKRDINKYNDAFMTAGAPKVIEKIQAELDTVKGAEQSLAKNEMVLNILGDPEQESANVGVFSGIRQTMDRAFSFFGSDEARKRASETEALQAFLGSDVFPMIKQLGIGARGLDTPAERKFLQEVMTGNIEQDPQTLRILTEYRRKLNTKIIDAYNQKVTDGYFKRYDSLYSTDGFNYESKPIEYNKDYKYRFLPQVESIVKGLPKKQTTPSNDKLPADTNGDGVVDANEWKQYNQRK